MFVFIKSRTKQLRKFRDSKAILDKSGTALILLRVPLPGLAETNSICVDGKIIKDYITKMSGSPQMGRRSLTPGLKIVAEWAGGLFKQLGLRPAGENGMYFQSAPDQFSPIGTAPFLFLVQYFSGTKF